MSAADLFWAAPPVTRTMTAAAVAISVPGYMGLYSLYYAVWITENVLTIRQIPELWRLVSSFLITAPKLGMILDPYFLYTYGSSLERGSAQFSGPGDFVVYVIFLGVVILLSAGLYLGGHTFMAPLTLGLAYTWAQENPNQQLQYFIVTIPSKYMPYAMLALTFVMDSPGAALYQSMGLLAAHLYLFLTKIWPEHGRGFNPIFTPQFVKNLFASEAGTPMARSAGTAFAARAPQNAPSNQTGSRAGWSSGFSGGSGSGWSSRGQGHRLGGD